MSLIGTEVRRQKIGTQVLRHASNDSDQKDLGCIGLPALQGLCILVSLLVRSLLYRVQALRVSKVTNMFLRSMRSGLLERYDMRTDCKPGKILVLQLQA